MSFRVLAYRSHPMHYSGTEAREYETLVEAENVAGALRRTSGYFCVEVRQASRYYHWLGQDG